jgi:glycosyltransferase involved in cell wall biosynthesis
MRVLLLTDSDVFAGTERHILELGAGLMAAGVEVAVGAPSPSPLAQRCEDDRIPFHVIHKGGSYDRAAINVISRLFLENEIDIVHAHNGRTALVAALARQRVGRGKVIFTQHFLYPAHVNRSGLGGLASRLAHHWVNKRVSQTIAISTAVRDRMVARHPGGAERINVVHNGISDPVTSFPQSRLEIRRGLSIDEDIPLIVCAARLEEEKGISLLVDAMARLADCVPAARCLIAGQGSQQGAVVAQIGRLGLAERVRLLGFRPDVLDIISAADVFVLPAKAEPFGLVIVEAMAVGRAVVAVNSGGPAEIVEHERSGLLVPQSSSESIAGAIVRLLRSADLRDAMGVAGRQRFLERFTAERMARNTLDVYKTAMAS